MKTPTRPFVRLASLSLASSLLLGAVPSPAQTGSAPKAGEPITLNFNGADIDGVARTLGVITGRNVVIDPRVKGTITLTSERPVSPAAAWEQFLTTLRLQGFAVVEASGLYKVVPEAEAKLQGGSVTISSSETDKRSSGGNQIVTQIFRLNYESANNLVPVLRPLISPNNTINVNPGNNSVIITDYADNLQRLARIIASMDVPNASDVEVLPIKHAVAVDLAVLVSRLIDPGSTGVAAGAAQGQADTSFKTTLLAEPRSNSLILRAANPARAALVKSLVAKLDQPTSGANGAAGNIHVVYLKNADATKLATTLRAAMNAGNTGTSTGVSSSGLSTTSGLSSSTGSTPTGSLGSTTNTGSSSSLGASSSFGTSAQPSTGGQIQADPSTNSLIITAPEPQYRQLRAVIDKLDGRRAQVLVESLIVEVNANKVAQFGVQWQGLLGSAGGTVGLLGTNSAQAGANILSLSTSTLGTVLPGNGFNFGIGSKINGQYVLGFLAQFLENNTDGNVLSTPSLLTLDNEEAKIVIGQNVPFVTGTYTSTNNSTSTVNPFQTVERKDVGLTLRVKPQISENGTVRMSIYQEVSSIDASTKTNTNGPSTNKRSIESQVLVDDGAIVVLGGLLQDEYSGAADKVPGMGDLPILGNLFKSENRSRKKTNLMVFLRPVVVREASDADAITQGRYDTLRGVQQTVQPTPSAMMPNVTGAPVLPVLGPRTDAKGSPLPTPAPASSPAPDSNAATAKP
ncbi:type II secretion system secretin GspD [Curvibacter sp. HBC61]|uniref:Type II secretion system secretin GspD n=1 Tax=Curvibacter cyanobacteriorum TaxID=3026422 RepID=A0ABT5N0G6_9BURK|nr:type II secretion system secretin GspD [Curvibacter sp. HBC61]MDD0839064.1 type II secretion system secretin GspD [Curvibacter sp. HBC61]